MEIYLEAVAFYISIRTYPSVHQNVIQSVVVFKENGSITEKNHVYSTLQILL